VLYLTEHIGCVRGSVTVSKKDHRSAIYLVFAIGRPQPFSMSVQDATRSNSKTPGLLDSLSKEHSAETMFRIEESVCILVFSFLNSAWVTNSNGLNSGFLDSPNAGA
jgi:hypothetical protein